MANYTRLNIVRDCWWLIPSGTTANSAQTNYMIDHNGNLSSRGNSFASYLNDLSSGTYVLGKAGRQNSNIWQSGNNFTTCPYFGRLESTDIVPDRIKVFVSGNPLLTDGAAVIHTGVEFKFIVNNSTIFSQPWPSGATNMLVEKNLTITDKEAIFRGRLGDTYEWFGFDWIVTGTTFNQGTKRLDAKVYGLEVYYSGESSWVNYQTGLPATRIEYLYPSGITTYGGWVSDSGTNISTSDISYINKSTSGINLDTTYIQGNGVDYNIENKNLNKIESINGFNYSTYNGGCQKIGFNFDASGIPVNECQVARSILRLRMAHPNSGVQNQNDTFTVQGWNKNYAIGSDLYDFYGMSSDQNTSDTLYTKNTDRLKNKGYVLYGVGQTIGQTGFQTYNINLDFVDGSTYASNSGNISSIKYKDLDIFRNLELRVLGLPSGIKISTAEILLETLPNNSTTLYTLGNAASVGVNYNILQENSGHSYYSNGLGYNRIIQPLVDERVFGLGFTRLNNLVSDFSNPYLSNNTSINSTSGFLLGTLKLQSDFPAQLFNAYRNPGLTAGLYKNDYLNGINLKGSGNFLFTVNGDESRISCGSIIDNLNQWSCYLNISDSGESSQEETLLCYNNTSDYKWHLFRDNNGSNARIGLTYKNTSNSYTTVYSALNTKLGGNFYPDKILVSYDGNQNSGIFSIYVNDYNTELLDSNNPSFSLVDNIGPLLFSTNVTGGSLSLDLLGTNNYVASQNIGRRYEGNYYLKDTILHEFGFSNVAYTGASLKDTIFNDFYFSRTRLININNAGHSGIQFTFNNGSGHVTDSVSMYYIAPDRTIEWNGPIVTNNLNSIVNPSSIYVEYDLDLNTNHPSGLDLSILVDNDRYSLSNEFTYEATRSILFNKIFSSGNHQTGFLQFSKQFGFGEKPLSYSDSNELGTVRVSIVPSMHSLNDTNFYADLNIKTMKVYFDNIAVAPTGADDLDLYTQGAYNSSSNVDLYITGYSSGNQTVDLYIANGINYSGSTTLYTVGGYENKTMNLYSHGLLPLSGTMTMYIGCGTPSSGNTSLFINGIYRTNNATTLFTPGPVLYSGTDNLNMFTWSTTNSGMRDFVPLMVEAKDSILPDRVIPLFIKTGILPASSTMPLYLESHYDSSSNTLNMYTIGPNTQSSGVPLVVGGYGIESGSVPSNASITMFMARDTESEANRMTLFVSAPTPTDSGIDLFLQAAYKNNSGISMYIDGHPIQKTDEVRLYTHGY